MKKIFSNKRIDIHESFNLDVGSYDILKGQTIVFNDDNEYKISKKSQLHIENKKIKNNGVFLISNDKIFLKFDLKVIELTKEKDSNFNSSSLEELSIIIKSLFFSRLNDSQIKKEINFIKKQFGIKKGCIIDTSHNDIIYNYSGIYEFYFQNVNLYYYWMVEGDKNSGGGVHSVFKYNHFISNKYVQKSILFQQI